MLTLSQQEITGLLSPLELVAAVEAALQAQAVIMPQRTHLEWDGNTLLCMPAGGGGCLRREARVRRSQQRGPRTASDEWRRGVEFACAMRPLREIFCVSRSSSRLETFVATASAHVARPISISPCKNACELVERTDVIVTATTAYAPALPDEPALLENKHFISVGSYRPTMQELPNSVYRLSRTVAVDSEHARYEVGDIINPTRLGILRESDVYSIAECVTGRRVVDSGGTTVFERVGAAFYDL